ncbi:unnamed protein product, partial [Cylindrotheca closterium]
MSVAPKDIMNFVCLLSSLTHDFKKRQKGEKKITFEHVVPSCVIEMGKESRVHSGERILKRAIRNTLDPGTQRVDSAKFIFGYFQGDPCLVVLDHKVKASMRNAEYSVECAFTAEHLVASACKCKAGCRNRSLANLGTQRVFCTLGLFPLLQLSHLLFTFLAEHLLYELRIRLGRDEEAFSRLDIEDRTRKVQSVGIALLETIHWKLLDRSSSTRPIGQTDKCPFGPFIRGIPMS